MRILLLHAHGWRSVPGGVKPTCLKDYGHEVINPALPDEDFAEAVRVVQAGTWQLIMLPGDPSVSAACVLQRPT